jgi:hypothetical protein
MRCKNIISDESGFLQIGTLLVLIAVTAIGVTLIIVSNFEIDMSSSEKCKEEARYNSESCSISAAKLVKMVMDEATKEGVIGIPEGDSRILGVTYADAVDGDNKEVEFAMKLLTADQDDTACEYFSLTPEGNNMDAAGNLMPMGADAIEGNAANRQISGYGYGIGLGGAGGGGFANYVIIACRGGGCNSYGRHVSYNRFKRVPGISGGF